jgi:hypothetical protein
MCKRYLSLINAIRETLHSSPSTQTKEQDSYAIYIIWTCKGFTISIL